MYHAVVQVGHGVYGAGETENQAILDARRLGTPAEIRAAVVPFEEASHGDLVFVPCTRRLFEKVRVFGLES